MDGWKPPSGGPIDDINWPKALVARAIDRRGNDDRLHGYAMLGDIAYHYRYTDALYLAIAGELPSERASTLLDVALIAFASIGVDEAPCHLGVISRICGGTLASALGAGMIAVADQARAKVAAHVELLAWLRTPSAPLPDIARAANDTAWVDALDACARTRGAVPTLLRAGMSRDAAVIALLFEAGLGNPEQIESAMIAARLCGLVAETIVTSPAHLRDYPATLPPFHYVERP